jgi:hypothetical protein
MVSRGLLATLNRTAAERCNGSPLEKRAALGISIFGGVQAREYPRSTPFSDIRDRSCTCRRQMLGSWIEQKLGTPACQAAEITVEFCVPGRRFSYSGINLILPDVRSVEIADVAVGVPSFSGKAHLAPATHCLQHSPRPRVGKDGRSAGNSAVRWAHKVPIPPPDLAGKCGCKD